jgi:hypothetical protein
MEVFLKDERARLDVTPVYFVDIGTGMWGVFWKPMEPNRFLSVDRVHFGS